MANNLFVSYDLVDWDKYYEKVAAEIEKLGTFAEVHPTLWYVRADMTAEQLCEKIWAVMDKEKDALVVIDATNNTAHWENVAQEVADYFQSEWNA
jgi:hypothetical protein